LREVLWLGLLFAAVKVAIQVVANIVSQHIGYGIFRDEMYYLICGQRLAFGYVDQPPMVALEARVTQMLFGYDHMWSLRLIAAIAGGAKVLLTGLLARSLGGGRWAAALAMFAVLTAPVYLSIDSFLSMNALEPVFWMTAALALIEIVRLASAPQFEYSASRIYLWWIVLGASTGLGLETKATLVFYLVSLLLALLLTPARRILSSRAAAMGIAILVLLALPNFVWQATHHFATWEWLQAVQHSDKDIKLGPLALFTTQVLMLGPLHCLLWLTGAAWLALARKARAWQFAGLAYVFFLVLMMVLHAKDYYLAPAYPVLFAAGSVAWVAWAGQHRARQAALSTYAALLLAGGVLIFPYAVPVLSPERFLAYEKWTGFHPDDMEKHDPTLLPQFFADRFGWTDLLGKVSAIYNALPADERARTGIFVRNYGEASAINLFGPKLGLPTAISGHQNYWIWGPHGYSGDEMILVVQDSPEQLSHHYNSCTLMAMRTDPLAMPWERGPIYLCKGRKIPIFEQWSGFKEYR
jgi:hypothetical protein